MPLPSKRKVASGALVALAIGLTVSAAAIFVLRTPQNTLPITALRVAGELVNLEVARSDYELAKGMMFRKELAADAGMMFVFEQPSVQCFWMKNTSVPLSAAFLDESGIVTDVVRLEPHDDRLKCSSSPVMRVLEMSSGWFEARGVTPGQLLLEPGFN